jgi:hypothetical protein
MAWRGWSWWLLFGLCGLLPVRADELVLGERTVKGVFVSFGKGQFQFQTWDGNTLREKAMNVRKLVLDKPLKVVLNTRSRKDPETVLFKGFESGQFRLVRGEKDAVERESQVQSVAVHPSEQSFTGYMERAKQAEGEAEAAAETQAPEKLDDLVEMGKITVIHFHQPDSVTSTRQGTYCRRLAEDSHGRMVYKRVTVSGPEDPVVTRNGLTTLPQFWFYSRTSKLVTKLTERFTSEDFADAIKAARQGSDKGNDP